MSNQNLCPTCEKELEWDGSSFRCEDCAVNYKKIAFCPDCDAELEKLQACGAVSYFCNSCNEQKSKSRVRYEFQVI
ncbi:zinc ribbon domain-containing protein [Vibrio sp. JC009]|uniref:zinc ribbon domain-containing protein n=1 Tax=Vibrio sp. JC009 TaxID=2912314 RepID=UPI0023AFFF86|nr:zinc ribbon domain-containing protein [Vibrio sp. JC009]WED21337.1 zinc ribbon domain-containing protein [Vibrio sp. JC009]